MEIEAASSQRRPSDTLVRRVMTAVVGIPVVAAGVALGGPALLFLASAATFLGIWELRRLTAWYGRILWPASVIGSGVILYSAATSDASPIRIGLVVIGGGFVGAALFAYRTGTWDGARSWTVTAAAAIYPGTLLASGVALRAQPQGLEWLSYAIIVTFASDTGAYGFGKLLGRHRLAPSISPGKTWEGAIGALAVTAIASAALATLLELDDLPILNALALGVGLSIAGQLGDLAQSWLKRRAGVKESGGLLPGHGGILDRLDSMVLILPIVYYYVVI